MSRPEAPRNASKPLVRFIEEEGKRMVLKDASVVPWLLRRCFAQPSLAREERAYLRLEGVEGVPRCLGRPRPDRLLIERVDALPLSDWQRERLPPGVCGRLDRVLRQIHRRGVAVTDLHRSNVLVGAGGEVHLVDFALARIARDPARPGPLLRALFRLDRHAAARIRAWCNGEAEPRATGWFGTLYRSVRRLKRTSPQ